MKWNHAKSKVDDNRMTTEDVLAKTTYSAQITIGRNRKHSGLK